VRAFWLGTPWSAGQPRPRLHIGLTRSYNRAAFLRAHSIYFLTTVLTEVISNAATITLMFPIAYEMVSQGYITTKSMTYTLMMAGSSSFCTPIGYQVRLQRPARQVLVARL